MTGPTTRRIDYDDFDDIDHPRPQATDFDALAEKAVARMVSRRGFLGAGAALGAAAFLLGTTALAPAARANGRFGFEPVAANTLDTVTVPKGYSWQTVVRWGDPLWSDGTPFDQASRGTGASQEKAFGDNNDGMFAFFKDNRTILAVNNEYVNVGTFHGNRPDAKPADADDVRKSKAAHGVSIIEIAEAEGRWSVVRDSPFNRRITADTPMTITGPARGDDLVKTAADPAGTVALGTLNNCGSGRTPWDTYLTCEENFNGYFTSSDAAYQPSAAFDRYGVGVKESRYGWLVADERFDISKHPNEPNRFGYIVEIDPLDPTSTPKKRTALGRFKHENAELVIAGNGHVVVYLGDDERGEFLYKFVSAGVYREGGENRDLLESGQLSVAKFADGGRGEWVELTPASTGMASPAEIAVHTRQAASAVGATTMDRPEWVAANPHKAEAYCCLTNNRNRGVKPNAGGDAAPAGGPNPRDRNDYGQIVRWRPDGGDHTAAGFAWDLYVVAGNPTRHTDAYAGSSNVTAANMFNAPDGLAFAANGMLFIQTDGNYSDARGFAGMGNNQMLVGDPETGEIHRFLVGPKECEVTGITWSADRRTLFVGIQHPGEKGHSHWPDGAGSVPRSAVVAIRRDDGSPIG